MKHFNIFLIFMVVAGGLQTAGFAQTDSPNMELVVSDEEKTVLFTGFAAAVIAIFLFLARDVILRRKKSYDKNDLESKKDKTYEKYHSGWGDDYEEIGGRRNTKDDEEFRNAADRDDLPNYYNVLRVPMDATQDEIKNKFRELAKKTHPDKTTEADSEKEMAELNKAYEVLSDRGRRERYDRYLKTD